LTAAHCITTEFEYDYKGETFIVTVKPNEYYPTWESMFTVYIGMHSTILESNSSFKYGKALSVAQIIKVCTFQFIITVRSNASLFDSMIHMMTRMC
jgi:hypothetical protein